MSTTETSVADAPTEELITSHLLSNDESDDQVHYLESNHFTTAPNDTNNHTTSSSSPYAHLYPQQQHPQWDPISKNSHSTSIRAPPLDELDFESQIKHKEPPPQYEIEHSVNTQPQYPQPVVSGTTFDGKPVQSNLFLDPKQHQQQQLQPASPRITTTTTTTAVATPTTTTTTATTTPTTTPQQPQLTSQQQQQQQQSEVAFPILKPKPIPGLREYQAKHHQQQHQEAARLHQMSNPQAQQQYQQLTPQQQQQQQQQPDGYRPRGQLNQKALCGTCREPYALPAGSSTWRCKKCGEFQNVGPRDCVIM